MLNPFGRNDWRDLELNNSLSIEEIIDRCAEEFGGAYHDIALDENNFVVFPMYKFAGDEDKGVSDTYYLNMHVSEENYEKDGLGSKTNRISLYFTEKVDDSRFEKLKVGS